MSEETEQETVEAATELEIAAVVESMVEETVATKSETVTEETVVAEPEVTGSMDGYADGPKTSFKELDEKHSRTYIEGEPPNAEK